MQLFIEQKLLQTFMAKQSQRKDHIFLLNSAQFFNNYGLAVYVSF